MPVFADGDIGAKQRVWNEVKTIVETLAQPENEEKANRTTFAVAEVEMKSGGRETWIASAGQEKRVPRKFRTDMMKIKASNIHPDGQRGNNLNDAESKLIRQAQAEGVTIKAIGASREMCLVCQTAADDAGVLDTVVTPMEDLKL